MAEFILCDFSSILDAWKQIYINSPHKLLFSSPDWSKVWWDHFGKDNQLYLGAVVEHDRLIGIAPLRLNSGTLYFIGDDNVCDFLDFVIEDGKEDIFFNCFLEHLMESKFNSLNLAPLLPDSATYEWLSRIVNKFNLSVTCNQVDVVVGMDLPQTLSSYLAGLKSKYRHELLRKERRLIEEGDIDFTLDNIDDHNKIELFLRFFRESRKDKNKFLTPSMEAFFKNIIEVTQKLNILRMGILQLNSVPVAATLCFLYQNDLYLYNSGYDPDYRWLSVGLLSKYYCIKRSIDNNLRRFDFLRGGEKYKFHLGGKEVPLYRCIISNG